MASELIEALHGHVAQPLRSPNGSVRSTKQTTARVSVKTLSGLSKSQGGTIVRNDGSTSGHRRTATRYPPQTNRQNTHRPISKSPQTNRQYLLRPIILIDLLIPQLINRLLQALSQRSTVWSENKKQSPGLIRSPGSPLRHLNQIPIEPIWRQETTHLGTSQS